MNTAQLKLPPLMTVAEFIEWTGDGTGTRYELVDGILRAMAPASDTHNTILIRLGSILTLHLDGKRSGCRVVGTPGIQPRARSDWNFRIPDLAVTCAPNVPGAVMTPDPILLCEILSPGNAAETWESVRAYTTLPSVREILIIHTAKMLAEVLLRDDAGNWSENTTQFGPGGTLELASIGLTIPVADIYAGTHLVSNSSN